jgi:protease-4
MKNFLKMTLATILGLLIFSVVTMLIGFGIIGAVAAIGEKQATMPAQAVLRLDMSSVVLGEQTTESDPLTMLTSGTSVAQIGIYDAVKAINAAAADPAVKYIYMTPDAASGGIAQIEEFRKALQNFKSSGKAIISYIENPSNAGYYLASVSDKIYMTPHQGGMNMFNGISTQLIFLKDILDSLDNEL